ncbi:putative zinc finger motif, C2HC5-type-domain-containing protein [Hyaloraphidium curvatum]|nr:putative zinc finger motif, C2HC5-type-domain-containing protein [Hyaloraphidium curvatum]
MSPLPPELADFAVSRISILLGFPEADAAEVAQSLASLQSAGEVSDWVASFLGDSLDAKDFAREFARRRFAAPGKGETRPAAPVPAKQRAGKQDAKRTKNQQPRPAPEKEQIQQWTNIPGVKVVDRRNENEEELFPARPKKTTPKPPEAAQPRPPSPPPKAAPPPEPKAVPKTRLSKNRKPAEPAPKADRRPCKCLATVHPLLTNCLTCGRIVCGREGPGPCFTCGTPVLSRDQQLELLAARMRGDRTALERAEEGRDKMLRFQRESAQRTVVKDAAADFDPRSVIGDRWATKQEKERALLRLKEEQRREEEKRRVRVIDLDLEKMAISAGKLPDEPRPIKGIPTNFPSKEEAPEREAELEPRDKLRSLKNPSLAQAPVYIPPENAAPASRPKKELVWQKRAAKEDGGDRPAGAEPAAPAPGPQKNDRKQHRKGKKGGWARVQHDLGPGGVDYEGGASEAEGGVEGTETECG